MCLKLFSQNKCNSSLYGWGCKGLDGLSKYIGSIHGDFTTFLEKYFFIEFVVLNRPKVSRKQVWAKLFCELCLKYWRISSLCRSTYERSRSHTQFGCLTLLFWAEMEGHQSSITFEGRLFPICFDQNTGISNVTTTAQFW